MLVVQEPQQERNKIVEKPRNVLSHHSALVSETEKLKLLALGSLHSPNKGVPRPTFYISTG